ncbi:ABC transporter ATP-binding protein [Fundidesulfovibrio butyratiphilus]
MDLRIDRGEFFVVAGPNGSGKSTLLSVLAGLIRPSRGEGTVLGRNIARLRPTDLAREAAYLGQFGDPCLNVTVEMAVMLGRSPRQGLLGTAGEDDRAAVRRAMALTRVVGLERRSLASLSGGERGRVLLAQALCRDPELLLLDEPTASLDPGHRMLVLDMLEDLRQRTGLTLVLVSHDLNPVAAYAGRVLLLHAGKVAALGPPDQAFTPEILSHVYEWPMAVDRAPESGAPRAAPLPGPALRQRSVPETPPPRIGKGSDEKTSPDLGREKPADARSSAKGRQA